jgi:hypothetical protein
VKLEGSLDAFSLPDIFQLLTFTKKTGGLHFTSEAREGVVWFGDGSVSGASSEEGRQSLARRLVGRGAVDDSTLHAAVRRASDNPSIGVARALLESGRVDGELLRQAATEQTVDAVFDLLGWTEGAFAFAVEESNPDDVGLLLPTDVVLGEATTRREAWARVAEVISSPQTVVSMPVVLDGDPGLNRDEWSLLSMIDGRRTVSELVDLTGAGHFSVASTLAQLVQRGLLSVHEPGQDHVSVVSRRQALLAEVETLSLAAGAAEPPVERLRSADAPVTPAAPAAPRPEPVLSRWQPEPLEPSRPVEPARPAVPAGGMVRDVFGSAAVAPRSEPNPLIERDPTVNRALLLRVIAGVRGL